MKMIFYLIVIIVLFLIFVRYLENTSVFYPQRRLEATPEDLGLPFEDVAITTRDHVKLHGWLIKAPSAKSTLIFFHGNAGNIGGRLGKISLFHQIGLNVLIIDYRGYGKSEGYPTEQGIYNDATAAYDYLLRRDDMQGQNIISYGASLGGAVAIDLAVQRPVSCVIADSTFSSAIDMAKMIYPFIPSFLIKVKMDSIGKIKGVSVPILFIHSIEDQTVPFVLGKKLFDAAPAPKEFIEIIGDHNDGHVQDEKKVKNGIRMFLNKLDLI
jgi:hypothetical protein